MIGELRWLGRGNRDGGEGRIERYWNLGARRRRWGLVVGLVGIWGLGMERRDAGGVLGWGWRVLYAE